MSSVAQQVRDQKERHPEQFCADPRCLWRIVSGRTGAVTPCPKHPATLPLPTDATDDEIATRLLADAEQFMAEMCEPPTCPYCHTPLADRGDGHECPGCVEKARGE